MEKRGTVGIARVTAVLDERSDDELLTLYATSRDEAAFGTLFRRHGDWVLRWCLLWAGNYHTANDAVQTTFLVLTRKAPAIDAGKLRPFLSRVAKRAAVQAKRSGAPRFERLVSEVPDVPAREPAPDRTAELDALTEAIASLPPECVEVVRLCFLEGYSVARAAKELGLKPGATERRKRTAIELLTAFLSARGVTFAAALAACRATVGEARASAKLIADTLGVALHGDANARVAALANGVFGAARLRYALIGLVVGMTAAVGVASLDIRPKPPEPEPRPVRVRYAVVQIKPDGIEPIDESDWPMAVGRCSSNLFMLKGRDRNEIWWRPDKEWEFVTRTSSPVEFVIDRDRAVYVEDGHRVMQTSQGRPPELLDGVPGRKQVAVDSLTNRTYMVKNDTEVHWIGRVELLDTSAEPKVVYAGGGNVFIVKQGKTDGAQVWAWKGGVAFKQVGPHDRWVEIDDRGGTRELAVDQDTGSLLMLKNGTRLMRWKGPETVNEWEAIGDFPDCKQISAKSRLYVLTHRGQVWRWEGEPMRWELYHANPGLMSIAAENDKLYGTLVK